MRRSALFSVTGLLTALSVAACSSDGGQTGTREHNGSATNVAHSSGSTRPAPTPSPTEPPAVSLETAWQDDEGYSFKVTATDFQVGVQTNVADQAPGEARLTISPSASGTLANTTQGRNAQAEAIRVFPVWASDSPVCTSSSFSSLSYTQENTDIEMSYCSTRSAAFIDNDGITGRPPRLEVGETRGVQFRPGSDVINGDDLSWTVPESDLSDVVASAKHPLFWALVLLEHDAEVNQCTAWSDDAPFVAVTPPGADICPLDGSKPIWMTQLDLTQFVGTWKGKIVGSNNPDYSFPVSLTLKIVNGELRGSTKYGMTYWSDADDTHCEATLTDVQVIDDNVKAYDECLGKLTLSVAAGQMDFELDALPNRTASGTLSK